MRFPVPITRGKGDATGSAVPPVPTDARFVGSPRGDAPPGLPPPVAGPAIELAKPKGLPSTSLYILFFSRNFLSLLPPIAPASVFATWRV